MDTDALRWFAQVADGVTVTEVGDLEMVSQSGVSRALARLETQVGTPLLRRSGRTLRMTHAGALFKRHVDALLHNLDDGLAEIDQLVDPETGTVALAFQHSLGTWLVPDLIRSFRQEHPRIQFALTQVRDDVATAALGGGAADLELGTRRFGGETGEQLITTEPLRIAIGVDHSRHRAQRVRLAELADEAFVGLRAPSSLRQLTAELCQRVGFRPNVVFEGDDLSTLRGLVAGGLGVALMPAPRAGAPEAAPGPVSYYPIEDAAAVRGVRLSWVDDRRLPPATRLFREHVLARVAARDIPPVSDEPDGPASS